MVSGSCLLARCISNAGAAGSCLINGIGFDECNKPKIDHDVMRISAGITDQIRHFQRTMLEQRVFSKEMDLCFYSILKGQTVECVHFGPGSLPCGSMNSNYSWPHKKC